MLPLPPVTNPLPLSPQQCQQLLFGSELEDQINAAITDMGELPFHAELERFWWAQVAIQTNLDLVHQYQQCYQDAVHRRELYASRLEANHFWERLSTYLPSHIPPPRLPTNPPPALVIHNLTNCPSIHSKLPQLQDKPSSHAAQNQQSSSHPIPISPHHRKGKKKDKGRHKQSPHPCSTCGQDDHPTDECLASDDSSTVHPPSPSMFIDLIPRSPKLRYPPMCPAIPPVIDMDNLCSMCGYTGHICTNCPKNLEARSRCNTCHKVGHFTLACPKN